MKRCRAITEKIAEEVSEITGEWLTIADMERMEFSEFLGFNLFCHDLKNVIKGPSLNQGTHFEICHSRHNFKLPLSWDHFCPG